MSPSLLRSIADSFWQSDIVSLATGSDSLFLGSANGTVRVLSRALKVVRTFTASDTPDGTISHIHHVPDTSYLITLAENLSTDPALKVWALDKTEKRTGGPKLLCTVAVQNGRRQFPVCELTPCREQYIDQSRVRH